MSLAGIRFDYIHAERLAEIQPAHINVRVDYQFDRAVKRGDVTEVPFMINATSNPSIVTLTIRGAAIIRGDIDLSNPPQSVITPVAQLVVFEVMLVLRELGIPPILVPPPPPPSQQQTQYF